MEKSLRVLYKKGKDSNMAESGERRGEFDNLSGDITNTYESSNLYKR